MRKLTASQIEHMIDWREAGWTYARIASRLGVTGGVIYYHCLKHGAFSPRSRWQPKDVPDAPIVHGTCQGKTIRRFTSAEDRQLLQLAEQGLPRNAIARQLGRAPSSITMRLLALAAREEFPA